MITPSTPCQINGVVPQGDGNYVDGEGFVDPIPVVYDPRLGWRGRSTRRPWSARRAVPSTKRTAASTTTGGPAFRFDRVVRYTDFNSFMTGTSTTTPIGVTGVERTDKRPNAVRFNIGIQRELGWHTVLDVAYVGDRTQYLPVQKN